MTGKIPFQITLILFISRIKMPIKPKKKPLKLMIRKGPYIKIEPIKAGGIFGRAILLLSFNIKGDFQYGK